MPKKDVLRAREGTEKDVLKAREGTVKDVWKCTSGKRSALEEKSKVK